MSTATTQFKSKESETTLLDSDLGFGIEPDATVELGSAIAIPKSKPVPVDQEVPPSPRSRVLLRLLAMADFYFRAGSIRQALDMYFDLLHNYPETHEAREAENRILDVARIHEQNGELHLARAIYEQLI